jgi:hypothetical protein
MVAVGEAPLAAAARAAPPVVAAFQRSGVPAVALDFGREVSVELRRGPEGVELCLSAPAGLGGAARLELAGLHRALVARGVTLARAEVRERPPRGGSGGSGGSGGRGQGR